MSLSKVIAGLALGFTLAACAGTPGPDGSGPGAKENTGTLLGGVSGAALGAAVAGGGTGSRVGGALIGGALGAIIGNRIGAAMDDEDKQRAYAAQIDALERGPSGAPVSWKNPDSAHYGSIVPGPTYQNAGRNCRSFTHTIYMGGQPETARGTACRNPDGTWTSVG